MQSSGGRRAAETANGDGGAAGGAMALFFRRSAAPLATTALTRFFLFSPCAAVLSQDEIREELEAKEVEKKVSGMKTLISLLLNGEVMPKLLMTVIRFVVPCDDHKIKKLLLVYWEVVEKTGPDGKLLPEMILVVNAIRNDMNHANEYIRGETRSTHIRRRSSAAPPATTSPLPSPFIPHQAAPSASCASSRRARSSSR